MSLLINLNDELKSAMRAKDSLKLEALRAIKAEVLLAQTSSEGGALLSKDDEIKLLQRAHLLRPYLPFVVYLVAL